MTRALDPNSFLHTRFYTFSVGRSIWDEFYAALPGVALSQSRFESVWYSGGSIDIYADPNSHAWTSRDLGGSFLNPAESGGTGGLINGISDSQDPTVGASLVDRVILNISGLCTTASDPVLSGYNGGTRPNLGLTPYDTTGFTSSDPSYANGYVNVTEYWRLYIAAAIANVRSKHSNVRLIMLQPNLEGPGGALCSTADPFATTFGVTRCTYTTRYIKTAMSRLCVGNVKPGWQGQVSSCSDFADGAGHVVTGAQAALGTAMAAFYANPDYLTGRL